jgi:hypothetical protein
MLFINPLSIPNQQARSFSGIHKLSCNSRGPGMQLSQGVADKTLQEPIAYNTKFTEDIVWAAKKI